MKKMFLKNSNECIRTLIALIITLATILTSRANDGVFFTSGNFLVPTHETEISVNKEILTITIGKDGYAKVDVYYEFNNKGEDKNVTMAFEASSPYNAMAPLNTRGVHPYIKDFTVSMNDFTLPYHNAVVACQDSMFNHHVDFTPLNLNKWKGYGEIPDSILPADNVLYNEEEKNMVAFAYAYYFDAHFKPGINKVHHTYQYKMSFNVSQKFDIPYWLTPAMRWANHKVDDFTLKIAAEENTEFCLADTLFSSAPFTSVRDTPIYHIKDEYGNHDIFAQLAPSDTIVWHDINFKPKANINIVSPLWLLDSVMNRWHTSSKVVVSHNKTEYRYIAECANSYLVKSKDYLTIPKEKSKITEYSAEKGQGWVSTDTALASKVNIRQQPSIKSKVIGTISATTNPNDSSNSYPCLGITKDLHSNDDITQWFKIKKNGKIGYVSQRVTKWTALRNE